MKFTVLLFSALAVGAVIEDINLDQENTIDESPVGPSESFSGWVSGPPAPAGLEDIPQRDRDQQQRDRDEQLRREREARERREQEARERRMEEEYNRQREAMRAQRMRQWEEASKRLDKDQSKKGPRS